MKLILTFAALLLALGASAQTLTQHMTAQLASRTNAPASCAGYGMQDNSNSIQNGTPVLNTNYWLIGVTNILSEAPVSRRNSDGNPFAGGYTMISPRHCLFASHQPPGDTNVWLLPNGLLYTNWIIAISNYIAGTDIGIALMSKTNPFFCKIFPNATNYIGAWQPGGSSTTCPPFVRYHRGSGQMWFYGYTNSPASWYEPGYVEGSISLGVYNNPSPVIFGDYLEGNPQTNGPYAYPTAYAIGGDSGGAIYGIINNEAVVVGATYSGSGTYPVANTKDAVDNAMAVLSNANSAPVYTTTLYDVSAFPIVRPNDGTPIIYAPAIFK